MSRRVLLALPVAALVFAAFPVASATAHPQFSCRASVANAFELEPIVANRPNAPCKSEDKAIVFQTFGDPDAEHIRVEAAHAKTEFNPGPIDKRNLKAHAEVAKVLATDGENELKVTGAETNARAFCKQPAPLMPFAPTFATDSRVAGVTINGMGLILPPGDAHVDIPLGPLGTIHLNAVSKPGPVTMDNHAVGDITYPLSDNFVIVRAVFWERVNPELDVIVSESTVDFRKDPNPCL